MNTVLKRFFARSFWVGLESVLLMYASGAVGGYLYGRCEKSKKAEYQKGYKAGRQSEQKRQ